MGARLALVGLGFASATLLQGTADATLQCGCVHVEPEFAPPLLIRDLRGGMLALHKAGQFNAAGSGGRGGDRDTMRSAEFCDPVGRPDHGLGDFEAFCCLWERLDEVRQELNKQGYELLEDMELHYVRYPIGGYYHRHVDDFTEPTVGFGSRGRVRRISFIVFLTDPDEPWPRAYEADGSGEEQHVDYLPRSGTLVLFDSCRLQHEVMPTQRVRSCLIGWFHSATCM